MEELRPRRVKTITEMHALRSMPKPEHPLISIINFDEAQDYDIADANAIVQDFYSIALKRTTNATLKYGQQQYDFDEGVMFFIAPNQVYAIETDGKIQHTGWVMMIHPDFLWNTPLARKMTKSDFFSYSVHEALYLSAREEQVIVNLFSTIHQEYCTNIDQFSQDIIIAQIEVLLNYSDRFYNRQFLTRKITNHKILERFELILADQFKNDELLKNGLPVVQQIASELGVSTSYLSRILKMLTGKTTQQHIQAKVIDVAKEKLSTTDLSVSEIAYDLGFEHAQSFNKLFKARTKQSPLEFRRAFN